MKREDGQEKEERVEEGRERKEGRKEEGGVRREGQRQRQIGFPDDDD